MNDNDKRTTVAYFYSDLAIGRRSEIGGKNMNDLAVKLSELLEVSVESAMKMYPVLKSQYIVYESLHSINLVVVLLVWISVFATIGIGIAYLCFYLDYVFNEREVAVSKKAFWLSLIVTAVLLVATIVLDITSLILAPDLHMILEFIK